MVKMLNSGCLRINEKTVCNKIENFIKEQVEKFERDGVILGISGGIDSAVCACLAVRALGKDKVFGLLMPERDSSLQHFEDAKLLVSKLGINYKIENIATVLEKCGIYRLVKVPGFFRGIKEKIVKKAYEHYYRKTGESPFAASLLGIKADRPYANLLRKISAFMRAKHRARMLLWYKYAEINNLLVVGCCNKTEELSGWFVKWGDSAADIAPIAGLYKTQVKQVASYLGVPEKIIAKIPSPDMFPGVTDEFAMAIDYEILDLILYGLEKKLSTEAIAKQLNINMGIVNYVKELVRKSRHMRELPVQLTS